MQSGEGDIRKAMVQQDAVDAIVALPGQLFFGTQIPACLWILAKDKSNGQAAGRTLRDRRQEILCKRSLCPIDFGSTAGSSRA